MDCFLSMNNPLETPNNKVSIKILYRLFARFPDFLSVSGEGCWLEFPAKP